MKTLLIALILTVCTFGQSGRVDTVSGYLKAAFSTTAGDTIYKRNFSANYKWVYVNYVDTNATTGAKTDTILVYVSAGTDTTIWTRVGVRSVYDGQVYPVITNTATNSLARAFLINVPRPSWIKLVLGNAEYLSARRGQYLIRASNENY